MGTEQTSPLFALDIGTHSVVGLILQEDNGQFEILDSIVKEHDERTMLDGQIHDIPSVANVIREVKGRLEERHGSLNKVCVAAAGRSLKTRRACVSIDITTKPIFNHDDVILLELSAVQQAQYLLANELKNELKNDAKIDYYCVGYSVITYSLDGEPIGSLLDQTGKEASVEVIATFLPSVVVESLLAALQRADLELEALTLEPIAAINVLIPPSMRRLNVALVDIGAGTSDIALTDENTVVAYGMVPVGGDEITEAISDQYLLDFPDAERIKKELTASKTVHMTDILGLEASYDSLEVISELKETICQLARSISDKILSLNGKAPKAVMLVGGGSMTPLLAKLIASSLNLPETRVAIRGTDAINLLKKTSNQQFGPELVTPIGIAIAAKKNPIEYISVTVNGRTLRLFDVKQLTVGDGLLAAGISLAKLYGKPGLAMMVTVQGRLISVPGEHGKPPTLLKNSKPTSLDEPLSANDELVALQGESGKHAEACVYDLIGDMPKLTLTVNGEKMHLPLTVLQNGNVADLHSPVKERDQITIIQTATLKDVLVFTNMPLSLFKPIHLTVNEETWIYEQDGSRIYVNGQPAELSNILAQGDCIEWMTKGRKEGTLLAEILESRNVQTSESITIFYNGEPIILRKALVDVKRGEETLQLDDIAIDHSNITITTRKSEPFILQDIFTVIDLDLSSKSGGRISITQNGKEASFTSILQHGDKINLKFVINKK
ncbi:cell division protein FtsA [bacterium LRH843]|nr:cell division protein FtsA [bacterium LRH843]